ncbi:hypothetical protein DFA_02957 [Cavenderia fasciculata]|uniref:Uncharacterized protein n=1 Tax=Cavenderia fasciculata TaxID=261658 RepID=F4PG79_CACFS|nr:uncharacterized protein DFA_02957 [Cavenderia fasciculata]EGG24713.1 hypothetical protein DFA_02957 [Cavenderia fasciculata]|eukprot:XP_004362564.1 hypothetical protein DFA_02957 [Cavenderia fasciculata]
MHVQCSGYDDNELSQKCDKLGNCNLIMDGKCFCSATHMIGYCQKVNLHSFNQIVKQPVLNIIDL